MRNLSRFGQAPVKIGYRLFCKKQWDGASWVDWLIDWIKEIPNLLLKNTKHQNAHKHITVDKSAQPWYAIPRPIKYQEHNRKLNCRTTENTSRDMWDSIQAYFQSENENMENLMNGGKLHTRLNICGVSWPTRIGCLTNFSWHFTDECSGKGHAT